MRTQIARWGNSLAVRLPRHVLDSAGLDEGASVELDVIDGVVRLVPAQPRFTLAELLAGVTEDNLPDVAVDTPRGAELL